MRVVPVWPKGFLAGDYRSPDGSPITRRIAHPWTVCTIRAKSTLVGRTTVFTASGFEAASKNGAIKAGKLVVRGATADKNPARLFNYDVDIATARLAATAGSAAKRLQAPDIEFTRANQANSATELVLIEQPRVKASVLAARANEPMGLPAIGQPVIRMALKDMGAKVQTQLLKASAKNALLEAGRDGDILNYAEDINRGYRVDVWDSVTRHWHRLCSRTGTYAIGASPITWGRAATLEDEGWVQLGATSKPEDVLSEAPPTEMRIHETVFDWTGWSLAAPRPGAALSEPDANGNSTPTKTFVGPDGKTYPLGKFLHPELPLSVSFAVPVGTLPRLRFGTVYRFRARAVDLAGNSIAFSAGSTTSDPGGSTTAPDLTVSESITHQRFEPVKPPTFVLESDPRPGEGPEVIVVRTFTAPTEISEHTENSARYITPQKVAVTMAEACGALDKGAEPGKPMDSELWSLLCVRDAYDFPKDGDNKQVPVSRWQPPVMPAIVPFLPDPWVKGATLTGLPGSPAASLTTRTLSTSARYRGATVVTGATSRLTVSSLQIDYSEPTAPWYEKKPFELQVKGIAALDARIKEHAVPVSPAWDATSRKLTVELPKAEQITVSVGSFMDPANLPKMGQYQWGLETHLPSLRVRSTALSPISTVTAPAAAPVAQSSLLPATVNSLIATSTIGRNWLINPTQKVRLIHAVDKPLIKPTFTSRAHMERKAGEIHSTLVDWMPISGKSTSKLEIKASWTECVDDPNAGAPKWGDTAAERAAHVFTLPVQTGDITVLNAKAPTPVKMVSTSWGKIPSTGQLIARTPIKDQRHFFGDTKHRKVTYTAVASSRFERYFQDVKGRLTFTSTSDPVSLQVPSSARPVPPVLDYVMPTFGWTRTGTTSKRSGGGLRVYLQRPWFSSGDDERLGVVIWPFNLLGIGLSVLDPFVTQWGHDPIFSTAGALPAEWPTTSHFLGPKLVRNGIYIPETTKVKVNVVGYPVEYDAETDRWFADITINQGQAYFPFIRLGLCRFQPYALPGLDLSSVVVADFAQLTPDRNASIAWSSDKTSFSVVVSGETYAGAYSGKTATMTVAVQTKDAADDSTGWYDATGEIELNRLRRTAAEVLHKVTAVRWGGSIGMPEREDGMEYRVILREYEHYFRYGETVPTRRLVYAETLPVQ